MEYTKTVWKDLPDTSTPITADKLNNLENGVEYLFENGTGGGDNLPVGVEMDFDGVSQDIPTGWESVTNPDSYSTSEVKTNMTWVDGKPIYRKVYILTAIAGNNSYTLDPAPSNVDLMWFDLSATFLLQESTGYTRQGINPGAGDPGYDFSARVVSKTSLNIYVGNLIADNSAIYATLLYTKTTD